MGILRIDHVQGDVPTGGAERACSGLWGGTRVPGGAEARESARARRVRFDTGTLQHHLGAERAFRAAGNAHVAFEVDGLDRLRDRLVASGCALAGDEPLGGCRRCCVADRCGNRMELSGSE